MAWAFALPIVLALLGMAGCAPAPVHAPAPASDSTVPIEVLRPEGSGPFPAVVVLHACNGIKGRVPHVWAQRLVGEGYVVALPDSFTPRGYPDGVCGDGTKVPSQVRAGDAYAALHLLEQRPDVVPARIGVIGFSHGGWTVMTTLNKTRLDQFRPVEARHDFAAAIALYPFCEAEFATRTTYIPAAPLLILAGALDDWTPAAPCEALTQRSAAAGYPVSIKVYPGARHGFDANAPVTFIAAARGGRGAHIGGNPAARDDSIVQVRAFFAQHLKAAAPAPR